MAHAEAHLVAQAAVFGPKELARLGRRILDVVAPEIAEEAEARRLAELEANAATADPVHDAASRATAPPASPDGCRTRLPHGSRPTSRPYANPRKDDGRRCGRRRRWGSVHPAALPAPDRARRWSGSWSPSTSPGSRSTAVMPRRWSSRSRLDSLRDELGTADLIGAGLVPGDELTGDTHHRSPGPTPRLHREDPSRRPRRRQHPARPRPRPATLQPRTTQGTPAPRHDLPGRGLRRSRHLGRGPPPRPLVNRRQDRPRQRAAALQPSSPPRPRHRLPHRPTAQRRPPLPPTEIGRCRGRSSRPPSSSPRMTRIVPAQRPVTAPSTGDSMEECSRAAVRRWSGARTS